MKTLLETSSRSKKTGQLKHHLLAVIENEKIFIETKDRTTFVVGDHDISIYFGSLNEVLAAYHNLNKHLLRPIL